MTANILPALAPFEGLGVPYRDYWDIYPPGIYIFWGIFGQLLHDSQLGYRIFHLLLSAVCVLITFDLIEKSTKNNVHAEGTTPFFCKLLFLCLFFSPLVNHEELSNVLLGTTISILALWICLFSKNTILRLGLSSFLFLFAGYMKEPFLFGVLVPFALTLRERKTNFVIPLFWTCAGSALAVFTNLFYLFHFHLISSYQEVNAFKRRAFFEKTASLFSLLPYRMVHYFAEVFATLFWSGLIGGFLFVFTLLFIFWKSEWKKTLELSTSQFAILVFVFAEFFGFNLQHRSFGHYQIQIIVPMILGLVVLLSIFKSRYEKYPVILFLFLFIPNFNYLIQFKDFKFYRWNEFCHSLGHTELPPLEIFQKDKTVLVVYGWATSDFYYFNRLKPYSRFFIVHSSILGPMQIQEWVNTFKKKLPDFVLYHTSGADMDVDAFEAQSLHLAKLLEACYALEQGRYRLIGDDCPVFHAHPERFIHANFQKEP